MQIWYFYFDQDLLSPCYAYDLDPNFTIAGVKNNLSFHCMHSIVMFVLQNFC